MQAGDPIQRGAFEAKGIFGQRLYINPKEELVIVVLSARSKAIDSSVIDDTTFFTAVARALKKTLLPVPDESPGIHGRVAP